MSDRHEKWQRVEPGTVIPAGTACEIHWGDGTYWGYPNGRNGDTIVEDDPDKTYVVDSSWRPPLELPTAPGSVVLAEGPSQIKRLWFCRSDRTWINENGTINGPETLTALHEVLFDAGAER